MMLLLSKPEVAWKEFAQENNTQQHVFKHYCLPLMITAATLLIVCELIFHSRAVHVVLVDGIRYFVTLFASYYIVYYFFGILMQKKYAITPTKEQLIMMTGYSFTVIYLLYIVIAIFPSFFFLWIFCLYTLYLVWVAAEDVFHLSPQERGFMVIGMSALVIVTPFIVKLILNMLTPNLQ